MSLTVDDFDFSLPHELIAQHPASERTGSRLLHVCGQQHFDRKFVDLPGLLKAGDLLVFNDTLVINARLFGRKESGGQVEIMLERIVDATHAICQIRASKAPKAGCLLRLADTFTVRMTGRARCTVASTTALKGARPSFSLSRIWPIRISVLRIRMPPMPTAAMS